ncbi:MAG: N-acyl homoserine lactonase family protein, partial [Dehalococcoidia bacterium]|nr:N-acyl homoserine lactonase family protein [Dehalococcoidia bacterium]
MPEHVIRPIPLSRNVGVSTYKMTYLVGLGSPQTRGLYVWYIDGPKENILVDAGSSAEMKATGGAGSPMFPEGHAEPVQTIEEGLGKLGLKPEDIDIVILTHAHEDHVQLAGKYPKAKFIVQKAELDFARNPHPIQQFTYQPKLIEGLNFEVIEGDTQIVDGVSVMLTPGHSPGGQSVIVDTAKGKAVITGCCCIRRNFEPPKELGVPVIISGIHTDPIQCYDSLIKIKNIADIIIPLHDSEFLEVDRIP